MRGGAEEEEGGGRRQRPRAQGQQQVFLQPQELSDGQRRGLWEPCNAGGPTHADGKLTTDLLNPSLEELPNTVSVTLK